MSTSMDSEQKLTEQVILSEDQTVGINEQSSEKVTHKNNSLPNGCLKHNVDDNGIIQMISNDNNSVKSKASRVEHDKNCSGNVKKNVSDKCKHLEENHVNSEVDNCGQRDNLSNKDKDFDQVAAQERSDTVTETDICESLAKVNISNEVSSDRKDVFYGIEYVVYESELQMPDIMRLITKDLSEPYSIYTYRYFIHNWPKLCFLAMDGNKCVGAIVCKLDLHKKMVRRGYIAMLAIDQNYRRRGIGSHLVMKAIRAMVADDCDEVVLETEITNKAALRLYENLGFVRDKRLFRYYLNGVDALRLKLWLR